MKLENPSKKDKLVYLAKGEGRKFDVAGARLTWKVRSEDTGERFCFFEQVLQPSDGVPLHVHTYTETFYILEGEVTFFDSAGEQSSLRATSGDVVLAPAGKYHGFANEKSTEARLLSISVPEHQRFFDAVSNADREAPFSDMAPHQSMQRVAEIGAETDAVFALPPAD